MASESTPLTTEQLNQFEAAMKSFHENKDDSQLATLFQIFDRDGNGRISRTELRVTMNSITIEGVSEQEVDEMLEQADSNSDGAIDVDEFMAIMKRQRGD